MYSKYSTIQRSKFKATAGNSQRLILAHDNKEYSRK